MPTDAEQQSQHGEHRAETRAPYSTATPSLQQGHQQACEHEQDTEHQHHQHLRHGKQVMQVTHGFHRNGTALPHDIAISRDPKADEAEEEDKEKHDFPREQPQATGANLDVLDAIESKDVRGNVKA